MSTSTRLKISKLTRKYWRVTLSSPPIIRFMLNYVHGTVHKQVSTTNAAEAGASTGVGR
jgi:hypothetical protein